MSDEKKDTNKQKEKDNPVPPPRPTDGKDLNSEHNRPKIRNEKE